MELSVVSISAVASGDISVKLLLRDGQNSAEESFVISAQAFADIGVSKGECTRELYELLEREGKIYAAYKRGMYILGFGAYSEKALLRKLLSKGFEKEAAQSAVERIRQKGFIDDRQTAVRDAQRCASKLWGERRIRAYLSQRGYSAELCDGALIALEEQGVCFDDICVELIRSRYLPLPEDKKEKQKLIAALLRYGYSLSQIQSALAKISAEE